MTTTTKRLTVGNAAIKGFVNQVSADNTRLLIGTGSYNDKDGNKVFKESISVFLDAKFDGTIPAKNDYVQVSGDMVVTPRKDQPDQLNVTMNVRFKNQIEKLEAPKKAEAPAGAPAGAEGGRDI